MSKQSKSNPEKGLRTVSIEFAGKTRTLKYTHSAIGNLEADANLVLRNIGVLTGTTMAFADNIIFSYLINSRIFSQALRHGLTHEDPALKMADVDAGIDSYIEAGGSKTDLIRAIQRAYKLATDPSSVASLERSWQILDARQKDLMETENAAMTKAEQIIADLKAKSIAGSPSTGLPESS